MKKWPTDNETVPIRRLAWGIKDAIKFAYNMTRKNKESDIPYLGYDIGEDTKRGSFSPNQKLRYENLKYQKKEQGRDALDILLVIAIQLGIEQGKRLFIDSNEYKLNQNKKEKPMGQPGGMPEGYGVAQSVIDRETQHLADLTTNKIKKIEKEKTMALITAKPIKQKELDANEPVAACQERIVELSSKEVAKMEVREKHLTTHEAAKLLYVSSTTVIAWIKAGKIKCQRTLGGHRRISMSEIEAVKKIMSDPDFEINE